MRIGLVGDKAVGQFDHFRRDVGVQVQTGHQRPLRPNQRPHAAQNLPFTILIAFGHHGAMQIQVNRLQVVQTFLQSRQNNAGDAFEGVIRHLG